MLPPFSGFVMLLLCNRISILGCCFLFGRLGNHLFDSRDFDAQTENFRCRLQFFQCGVGWRNSDVGILRTIP